MVHNIVRFSVIENKDNSMTLQVITCEKTLTVGTFSNEETTNRVVSKLQESFTKAIENIVKENHDNIVFKTGNSVE
ncbi:hypothetical protein [Rummeliibacillus suwonensis]|uniref:hypothetical protein n=1 Tax=Rummeliibacillus suwonensis TaxID=1306154 RepID=UPI001AAE3256|nr:hypothetical protein [Rummeliibacillus suwonensis]MBO2536299.1 hypothetical protein [Rummeliibacillus suwonensis]